MQGMKDLFLPAPFVARTSYWKSSRCRLADYVKKITPKSVLQGVLVLLITLLINGAVVTVAIS